MPVSKLVLHPYDIGGKAYKAGASLSDCPFHRRLRFYREWQKGWQDAKQQEQLKRQMEKGVWK